MSDKYMYLRRQDRWQCGTPGIHARYVIFSTSVNDMEGKHTAKSNLAFDTNPSGWNAEFEIMYNKTSKGLKWATGKLKLLSKIYCWVTVVFEVLLSLIWDILRWMRHGLRSHRGPQCGSGNKAVCKEFWEWMKFRVILLGMWRGSSVDRV